MNSNKNTRLIQRLDFYDDKTYQLLQLAYERLKSEEDTLQQEQETQVGNNRVPVLPSSSSSSAPISADVQLQEETYNMDDSSDEENLQGQYSSSEEEENDLEQSSDESDASSADENQLATVTEEEEGGEEGGANKVLAEPAEGIISNTLKKPIKERRRRSNHRINNRNDRLKQSINIPVI